MEPVQGSILANMKAETQPRKPFVSVVVPAYNEAEIIEQSLNELCRYMDTITHEYDWELIIVNDGSTDKTGEIAEAFASSRRNIRVLHHIVNFRLGQALRFAFNHCKGDYVITLDLDMSYSPDHIARMLKTLRETKSKIVIASPYMDGGKVSEVPWLRRVLSVCANRFLCLTAHGKLNTITGMVRAYDRKFLMGLDLKSTDVDINHEIIYKAELLGARVMEVPAHLDWSSQNCLDKKRRSNIRVLRSIWSCLVSGFLFRPLAFFIIPGFILFVLSTYTLIWVFIHVGNEYQKLPSSISGFDSRFSAAMGKAFMDSPHTFFVGGISLILAIQLISLAILAFQNRRYFEDLFHISLMLHRYNQWKDDEIR